MSIEKQFTIWVRFLKYPFLIQEIFYLENIPYVLFTLKKTVDPQPLSVPTSSILKLVDTLYV